MSGKRHIFLSAVVIAIACLDVSGQTTNRTPEAMVTIKVTDEVGAALTGMPVHVWFDDAVVFAGTTDSNGFYVAHGKCSTIDPPIRIEKKGYYTTSTRCRFTNILEQADRQWMPWNPVVTTVVKKVENPILMYAKIVETKIPRTNEWFGYDLLKGDWVAPQGRGVTSDFVFKVTGYWKDYRNNDSTLTLTFTRLTDGLVSTAYPMDFGAPSGSELFMPREAPKDGYESIRKWRKAGAKSAGKHDSELSDSRDGVGHVFRVRSVTNQLGQVTYAYYGELPRDVEFGGAGENGCFLKFTYYLNPTSNDRNLEFDPKRNLFKELKSTEKVTDP